MQGFCSIYSIYLGLDFELLFIGPPELSPSNGSIQQPSFVAQSVGIW